MTGLIQANSMFVLRLTYAHPDIAAQILMMRAPPPVMDEDDEPGISQLEAVKVVTPPGVIGVIQRAVAEYYGVSLVEMMSIRKYAKIAHARHVCAYLCKILTAKSFANIGRVLDRDHTTILSSVQKIEKMLLTDQQLAADIEALKEAVGA